MPFNTYIRALSAVSARCRQGRLVCDFGLAELATGKDSIGDLTMIPTSAPTDTSNGSSIIVPCGTIVLLGAVVAVFEMVAAL